MEHIISSGLKSKTSDNKSWSSMWLGLASLLTFPILGASAAVLRPYLDETFGSTIGTVATVIVALLCIAFIIYALVVNIRTFRRGERSWVMWLGLIPVSIIGLLLFYLVGAEILEYIWYLITGNWLGY